jgi:hypothetical protein
LNVHKPFIDKTNNIDIETCRPQPNSISIFKVPFPRNPQFIGRTKILKQIPGHLFTNAKPDLTARLSLYGLGGVGKTQIAIEYVYLHKSDYDIICWLQAKDWSILLRSFIELSQDDQLSTFGAPRFGDEFDAFSSAAGMKSWFDRFKWLLIFDNADKIRDLDDPHSVGDLIPKGQNRGVLITSRHQASDGELASAEYKIVEMTENEAIKLLSKSSRIKMSQDDEWSPRLFNF